MIETHTRKAVVCMLLSLAVLAAAVGGIAGTAEAQTNDPETANEYFETFRAMEDVEAYQEYQEFETIRTFAVSRAQEVGTLEESDRAEFAAVLNTMRSFREAYERAQAGEYESSLAAAEEAETAIDELEPYEQTQATLADLGLTRFYASLGDGLRNQATSTERTPDRIELLNMTATAYERANRPNEAAEFNLQAEQLTAEYNAAVERMDEAEEAGTEFMDSCLSCDTVAGALGGSANPIRTFERYQTSQTTLADVREAQATAADNGLQERSSTLGALASDVSNTRFSLAVASVSILVGYGLIVGLVSTAALGRVFRWRQTYDMAQIGSVVSGGDGDA